MKRRGHVSRFLTEVPPLVGTLGHAEAEHAAAVLLWVLHRQGKGWGDAVALTELGREVEEARKQRAQPVWTWSLNPFFRPSIRELVTRGWAVRTEGGGLQLTPACLERVKAHL